MAAMTPAKRQALIETSGLFDPAYYLSNNGDVAASPCEPFFHYVSWGADENRRPSERFDPRFYAAECELQGVTPGNCIMHYLQKGRASGLFATPLDCTLQLAGFQRHQGVEPNDLFRFADPTPELLVKLIRTDFAGVGEQVYVDVDEQQPRRQWFIVDRETRISRHTRICEIVMGGLLHARIDRLCPRADEYRFSTSGWLRVICAAWNPVQRENASVAGGSVTR